MDVPDAVMERIIWFSGEEAPIIRQLSKGHRERYDRMVLPILEGLTYPLMFEGTLMAGEHNPIPFEALWRPVVVEGGPWTGSPAWKGLWEWRRLVWNTKRLQARLPEGGWAARALTPAGRISRHQLREDLSPVSVQISRADFPQSFVPNSREDPQPLSVFSYWSELMLFERSRAAPQIQPQRFDPKDYDDWFFRCAWSPESALAWATSTQMHELAWISVNSTCKKDGRKWQWSAGDRFPYVQFAAISGDRDLLNAVLPRRPIGDYIGTECYWTEDGLHSGLAIPLSCHNGNQEILRVLRGAFNEIDLETLRYTAARHPHLVNDLVGEALCGRDLFEEIMLQRNKFPDSALLTDGLDRFFLGSRANKIDVLELAPTSLIRDFDSKWAFATDLNLTLPEERRILRWHGGIFARELVEWMANRFEWSPARLIKAHCPWVNEDATPEQIATSPDGTKTLVHMAELAYWLRGESRELPLRAIQTLTQAGGDLDGVWEMRCPRIALDQAYLTREQRVRLGLDAQQQPAQEESNSQTKALLATAGFILSALLIRHAIRRLWSLKQGAML